jgi:hypothetical protein
MGLQQSVNTLALPDVPNDSTTFVSGGTDQISVIAFNADAKVELYVEGSAGDRWLTERAIRVRHGLHKPIAGLATAYPPKGVIGYRFSNWLAGAVSTIDFEAYGVG